VHPEGRWKSTRLWEELSSRRGGGSDEVVGVLVSVMPIVESVVGAAGTDPKDFTLHDKQHAALPN